MYKIITFSFFIFLGITATAQEIKMIFGKILNQEDQPISNAIISARCRQSAERSEK